MWYVHFCEGHLNNLPFTMMSWRMFSEISLATFFPFVALGIEPRTLHMQRKCPTTEQYPKASFIFNFEAWSG